MTVQPPRAPPQGPFGVGQGPAPAPGPPPGYRQPHEYWQGRGPLGLEVHLEEPLRAAPPPPAPAPALPPGFPMGRGDAGGGQAAGAPAAWPVPVVDFGEVELGPEIGEGGFGRVHRGRWRGREVAVKVCAWERVGGVPPGADEACPSGAPENALQAKMAGEFVAELELMAQLPPHPHLLRPLAACIGESGGRARGGIAGPSPAPRRTHAAKGEERPPPAPRDPPQCPPSWRS